MHHFDLFVVERRRVEDEGEDEEEEKEGEDEEVQKRRGCLCCIVMEC